ncbi:MAG: penicillin-binding protein activator [Rhodospirillales bacterium]|nr:penicillin-binding protein activator [Rhodospirillales bacterium]
MTQNLKATLIALFLLLPALSLSACQSSSGGYTPHRASAPSAPARQDPHVLENPSSNTLLGNQQQAAQTMRMADLPAVKVGILLPLSGQHQKLGEAMLNAAQMALFEIGHANLELIPRDTQGTAQGAGQAAKSAIDSGAQLLLGPVFAPSVRSAQPIAARARINMIAFSTDWTLAGNNTYIMGFMPFDQVRRVTGYAARQGIARVGMLGPDTDYGRIVASAFNAAAPSYNIAVTENKTYPASTTNLAPIIKDFTHYDARKSAGALAQSPFDAVLMPVGGQDARSIGSLLTHYGLPPRSVRRIGTGLLDETALASEANLEGSWFAAPTPASRRAFEDRYMNTYGARAPRLTTLAYDATALAAILARRGLQASGRPAFDRNAITNANGFSGLDGIFRFRSDNTAERGLAVLEFRRGQLVVVEQAPTSFQNMTQ